MPRISKERAKELIQELIDRTHQLYDGENFARWKGNVESILKECFNETDRTFLDQFNRISYTAGYAIIGESDESIQRRQRQYLEGGYRQARGVLQAALDDVENFWVEDDDSPQQQGPSRDIGFRPKG